MGNELSPISEGSGRLREVSLRSSEVGQENKKKDKCSGHRPMATPQVTGNTLPLFLKNPMLMSKDSLMSLNSLKSSGWNSGFCLEFPFRGRAISRPESLGQPFESFDSHEKHKLERNQTIFPGEQEQESLPVNEPEVDFDVHLGA